MSKRQPRKPPAKDNLVTFPGCHVADYCVPMAAPCGSILPFYINSPNMKGSGLHFGKVLVCRQLEREEAPPPACVCLAWIQGERYVIRLRTARGGYWLADDTAEKYFERDEVRVEAVALYVCSCDLMGKTCSPRHFSGRLTERHDAAPWDELGEEWKDFIDELEDEED
ncbi:MAG: hypothetical protein ACJ74Q_10480 [Pyrinomonadaceae bacterium]